MKKRDRHTISHSPKVTVFFFLFARSAAVGEAYKKWQAIELMSYKSLGMSSRWVLLETLGLAEESGNS